jgi:tRNA threonylcarbamoyladenosine biosynthesis protein TsaE
MVARVAGTTLVTHSAAQTRAVARDVAVILRPGDIVWLIGGLGAGKTEFAKGLGEGLGIAEPIVSPTFMLAREYQGRIGLLHVDLYRLERAQEVIDLGLEDLAADEAVTVVEWGDAAAAHLPVEHLEIRLDVVTGTDDDRLLTLTPIGTSWWARDHDLMAAVHRGGYDS